MPRGPWALVASVVLVAGCGLTLDYDPPDPQPGADAGLGFDAGPPLDAGVDPCATARDGDACGSAAGGQRLVCLAGTCSPSRCGDRLVDADAGEECDDGNEIAGDGCEPFACVHTCEVDADCDDGVPCNGIEACRIETGCIDGTPITGVGCTLRTGGSGLCTARGLCVPPGCGDGLTELPEECDDANDVPNDGCEADCTLSCEGHEDCDDADACNGPEICTERGCITGAPPLCGASDPCHVAGCDPMAVCFETLVDADGDGHSPRELGTCGDDCDDARPDAFLSAPEQCNALDDDCDGVVDEDIVEVACHPDRDADGFGDTRESILACVCPIGSTTVSGDCHDVGGSLISPLVRPDQTDFLAAPYCDSLDRCSHDYDCDGREEPRFAAVFGACRLLTLMGLCVGSGWLGGVPACGASGTWVDCETGLGGGGGLLCRERTTTRVQPCR